MKTVYGPVPSWRLGRSLGIDLISRREKVCSFDCIYCQLGRTKRKIIERRLFVETERVKRDLLDVKDEADVITFSGVGEPTLAKNLGEALDVVKGLKDYPTAVLTNSSLIREEIVRKELSKADIVVVKLDAPNPKIFQRINNPHPDVRLEEIVYGIKAFKKEFEGKLALQVMFVKQNKNFSKEIAELAREIEPEEVQINTPLRPCGVKPLSPKEIDKIEGDFYELNVISVYKNKMFMPTVHARDIEEIKLRRGPHFS